MCKYFNDEAAESADAKEIRLRIPHKYWEELRAARELFLRISEPTAKEFNWSWKSGQDTIR